MLVHKAMHTFNACTRPPWRSVVAARWRPPAAAAPDDTAPAQGDARRVSCPGPESALGSPVDITYRFTVAADAAGLRRRARSSSTSSTPTASRCGPTTTTRRRRPRRGSPGRPSNTRRTMFAPVVSLRGPGADRRRALRPAVGRPAEAVGHRGRRPGLRGRPSSSCCRRPRTSSSSSRTAGTPSRPPATTRWSSGSGPRRRPRSRSATRAATPCCIFQADNPARRPRPPRQVEIRLGDQVLQTFALGADGARCTRFR